LFFSVHQEDERCKHSKAYIDFGLSILRLNICSGLENSNKHTFTLIASTGNQVMRENQTDELTLPKGQYIIVPTSSGGKLLDYFNSSLYSNVKLQQSLNNMKNASGEEEKGLMNSANKTGESIDINKHHTKYSYDSLPQLSFDPLAYLKQKLISNYELKQNVEVTVPIVTKKVNSVIVSNIKQTQLEHEEEEHGEEEEYLFTQRMDTVLNEIFDRLDIDNSDLLTKQELDTLSMLTEGIPLGNEAFEWMLDNFECGVIRSLENLNKFTNSSLSEMRYRDQMEGEVVNKHVYGLTRKGFKQSQMFIVRNYITEGMKLLLKQKESEQQQQQQESSTSVLTTAALNEYIDPNRFLDLFRTELSCLGKNCLT
jgi:hypothetical protein